MHAFARIHGRLALHELLATDMAGTDLNRDLPAGLALRAWREDAAAGLVERDISVREGEMMPDIVVFYANWAGVSPGGQHAFGIKVAGVVVCNCIGSGDNFRDAKACALRNISTVLRLVQAMEEPNQ